MSNAGTSASAPSESSVSAVLVRLARDIERWYASSADALRAAAMAATMASTRAHSATTSGSSGVSPAPVARDKSDLAPRQRRNRSYTMARTRAMGNSARAESMSRGAPTTRQTVTIKTAAVSIFEGPLLKPAPPMPLALPPPRTQPATRPTIRRMRGVSRRPAMARWCSRRRSRDQ